MDRHHGSRHRDTDSPSPAFGTDGSLTRRQFVASTAILAGAHLTSDLTFAQEAPPMYGLIGKIDVVAGQREELAAILLEGVAGMPGCRSYVVANDPENPDAIWITEVWDNQESHQASLSLPSVQAAIAKGRPLITGFAEQTVTEPIGGHGLV